MRPCTWLNLTALGADHGFPCSDPFSSPTSYQSRSTAKTAQIHRPAVITGVRPRFPDDEQREADQYLFGSRPSCTAQYSKMAQPINGMKLSNRCHPLLSMS